MTYADKLFAKISETHASKEGQLSQAIAATPSFSERHKNSNRADERTTPRKEQQK